MQRLKFLVVFQAACRSKYNDARMKLAEIYEIMGELRKVLDLVYEGN